MAPRVSSNLEDNIGNAMAPMLYSVSTMHCLTVFGDPMDAAYVSYRAAR
jgi:hypothetical protein